MKNLIKRSITGILYVGAIVGAVLAGGWWLWAIVTLFAILGVAEFNRITNKNFVSNTTTFLDIIGAFLLTTAFSPGVFYSNVTLICLVGYPIYLIIRFISQLYVQDGNALSHLAHSILGQVYVVIPLALLEFTWIVCGSHLVLLMFILIWINDTGAFCVGSMFGKHRLFERISPKKSWEGFFGGLAFCLLISALALYFFPFYFASIDPHTYSIFNIWTIMGLGAVVCIFGTWGDLVESMIKRAIGVKDSGNILPGHGGILDRIDSLLMVVPTMLLYILVVSLLK